MAGTAVRRVLVTGGSGAVGRYVVEELLQHGYAVGVLDRVAPQQAQVRFHQVDILISMRLARRWLATERLCMWRVSRTH